MAYGLNLAQKIFIWPRVFVCLFLIELDANI